jgi:hypothetical protein
MSHFIICSFSGISLGIPNGHARTQFEQAMQRGFNDEPTIPSSYFLMASAGQTCAQVGFSQCQQTYAAVAMLSRRSTKSKLIMDTPRCVSHSSHAFTQDWQPMQRDGST